MGWYRTKAQLEADSLDLDLFNLSSALQQFADRLGDKGVDDASRIVFGLRERLRKHMHPEDIAKAATAPSREEG